jgi:hypothetical protein
MIAAVVWLVGMAIVIGLMAAAILWHAYVFCILWAWFAVPITGWPPLGMPAAVGLLMLVSAARITSALPDKKRESAKEDAIYFAKQMLHFALRPAILLLAGWCAKGFI